MGSGLCHANRVPHHHWHLSWSGGIFFPDSGKYQAPQCNGHACSTCSTQFLSYKPHRKNPESVFQGSGFSGWGIADIFCWCARNYGTNYRDICFGVSCCTDCVASGLGSGGGLLEGSGALHQIIQGYWEVAWGHKFSSLCSLFRNIEGEPCVLRTKLTLLSSCVRWRMRHLLNALFLSSLYCASCGGPIWKWQSSMDLALITSIRQWHRNGMMYLTELVQNRESCFECVLYNCDLFE